MDTVTPVRAPAVSRSKRIVAWGDSLTAGNTSGPGNSYPAQLERFYDRPRPVLNHGRGGETAEQICARMLAAPAFDGDITIIWAGTNNLVETPDEVVPSIARMVDSLAGADRFLVLSLMNTDRRNQWKGGKFHDRLCAINDELAASYGKHFLCVRSVLLASFEGDSTQDRLDVQHDVVPGSLRVDKGHLNAKGNTIVAKTVFAKIARTWV